MRNVAAILIALFAVSVFATVEERVPAIAQVWLDEAKMTFHSLDCAKITPEMRPRARTVAKMQGYAPAKECAVTDAEADRVWKAKKLADAKPQTLDRSKVRGYTESTKPLPPVYMPPPMDKEITDAIAAVERARTPKGEPEPSRTDEMKASDFYSASDVIRRKCQARWPGDAEMFSYCVGKQQAAVSELKKGRPFGMDEATYRRARVECAARWPDDYDMRVYCESKSR